MLNEGFTEIYQYCNVTTLCSTYMTLFMDVNGRQLQMQHIGDNVTFIASKPYASNIQHNRMMILLNVIN